ncbi:MAG: DUF58 domain-containing protein [Bacteroidota bacterium]|nr:DUF58 domain-containing protein [Bacteroidota bacterium]
MTHKELIKKVRKIEIKTKGLSKHIFAGEYHSAFKGRGMAFSEVRDYNYGDDVRDIDWNVTARFNKPYIKVFEEERELTVMLLVDISGSESFGTQKTFKNDLITELSAVIAFSAIQNNDKIGVIFFSDKVEKFIPPKKGTSHTLHIIKELIDFKPDNQATNISEALRYMTNIVKKRCTAFIISDFYDNNFSQALRIAGHKHDVIALQIYDERETKMPRIGFVKMKDAETGEELWVNTANKKVRQQYEKKQAEFYAGLKQIFRKAGVDHTKISTNEDYIKPLLKLFKQR